MKIQISFLIAIALAAAGCTTHRMALPKPPAPPKKVEEKKLDYTDVREHSYRTRSDIPTEENRYEGSLWRDESSWGNLLRDHRARFKHDVVTITNLQEMIVIPKKEPKPAAAPVAAAAPLAGAGEAQAAQAIQAMDAVQKSMGISSEEEIENEQNEVLGNLSQISARVVQVLPNGNMLILGEKVDYRQQNSVRYVTKIRGIIRPEDVTEKNEIGALKLASSEVKIKRQVQAKSLNLKALAPIVGKNKAGLFDRISHMATPGKGQNKQAPVQTAK